VQSMDAEWPKYHDADYSFKKFNSNGYDNSNLQSLNAKWPKYHDADYISKKFKKG
jgi:hypothetical protein